MRIYDFKADIKGWSVQDYDGALPNDTGNKINVTIHDKGVLTTEYDTGTLEAVFWRSQDDAKITTSGAITGDTCVIDIPDNVFLIDGGEVHVQFTIFKGTDIIGVVNRMEIEVVKAIEGIDPTGDDRLPILDQLISDVEDVYQGLNEASNVVYDDIATGYGTDNVQDTINYMDSVKLGNAPSDGKQYARQNGTWQEVVVPEVDRPIELKGSDTIANILAIPDAIEGDMWITTDAGTLDQVGNPNFGATINIGDGLVMDVSGWWNILPIGIDLTGDWEIEGGDFVTQQPFGYTSKDTLGNKRNVVTLDGDGDVSVGDWDGATNLGTARVGIVVSDVDGIGGDAYIVKQVHNGAEQFPIYHEGNKPTAEDTGAVPITDVISDGQTWDDIISKIPKHSSEGVLGIGRYIDFHTTNSVADYDIRLDCSDPTTLTLIGGDFVCTGNVTAYSDERVKTDIKIVRDPIKKVQAIRGVTYERADMECDRQTGVIAQEVQKVLPEAVVENEDGKLSVAYGNMVGLLVEAIKEQQTQIEELKVLVKNAIN